MRKAGRKQKAARPLGGEETRKMNYTEDIYQKAEAFLGEGQLSSERGAVLESMCELAAAELEARLREGLSPQEIREQFVIAAGILALSLYISLGEGESLSAFKAGNIAVTKKTQGQTAASAASLRKMAEAALGACLEDRGFDFRGVRG